MKKTIIIFLSFIAIFMALKVDAFTEKVVISGMDRPWAVVSGPDGNIWITEKRSGNIYVYNSKFEKLEKIKGPENMSPYVEGGLMDLAFHPNFKNNQFLYLTYSVRNGNKYRIQVARFKYMKGSLNDQKVIIEGAEGEAGNHFGSRLLFDRKVFLYATFGERIEKEKAQDMTVLHGKIVRLNDDGSIPKDNPFAKSPIYSLGHRNPQGLALHPISGKMYDSEHGPSSFDAPPGGDEINEIIAGANYGWPQYHHRENGPGMTAPLLEYTPAIAPSGAIFYTGGAIPEWKNDFFVACLRGQQLLRVRFDQKGRAADTEVLLKDKYGRLRDVETSPDGSLLVLAEDGRLIQLK
jgi:aldose sugar dehydrogenase